MSPTSTLSMNISRDGKSTSSLGRLFQCLTTFTAKDFFLIPSFRQSPSRSYFCSFLGTPSGSSCRFASFQGTGTSPDKITSTKKWAALSALLKEGFLKGASGNLVQFSFVSEEFRVSVSLEGKPTYYDAYPAGALYTAKATLMDETRVFWIYNLAEKIRFKAQIKIWLNILALGETGSQPLLQLQNSILEILRTFCF